MSSESPTASTLCLPLVAGLEGPGLLAALSAHGGVLRTFLVEDELRVRATGAYCERFSVRSIEATGPVAYVLVYTYGTVRTEGCADRRFTDQGEGRAAFRYEAGHACFTRAPFEVRTTCEEF